MAHSHYVLDLYFRADERTDRLTREVLRIDAKDDAEALAEGLRVHGWKRTHHYDVRAIQTASRTGHKVIYSSPVEEAPAAEDHSEAAILLDDGSAPASPPTE